MYFLEQQQAARRVSRLLRVKFALAGIVGLPLYVLTTSVLLSFITMVVAGFLDDSELVFAPLLPWLAVLPEDTLTLGQPNIFRWAVVDVLFAAALGVAVLVWRHRRVRAMTQYLARKLGAVPLSRKSAPFEHRQLLNVVEEMSLAAVIPAPTVYTWGETTGINAFTVGHGVADASIFVSRGALAMLDRAETQALVAHEYGHILSGDVALYGRLSFLNFLFAWAPKLGRALIRFPRDNSLKEWQIAFLRWFFWLLYLPFGLVLFAAGEMQFTMTRLLQAGVLRQRERLADAHAMQFTRDPSAFKGLLMKITFYGGLPGGQAHTYREFEHSCFTSVSRSRWFDAHPTLEQRLRAADPRFHPSEIEDFRQRERTRGRVYRFAQMYAGSRTARRSSRDELREIAESMAGAALATKSLRESSHGAPLEPVKDDHGSQENGPATGSAEENPQTGMPPDCTAQDAAHAAAHAARERVLALVLDRDAAVRRGQLDFIASRLGKAIAAPVRRAFEEMGEWPADRRTMVLDQLLGDLRHLPASENRTLLDTLRAVQRLDTRVEVFEFGLNRAACLFLKDLVDPRAPHGDRQLLECAPSLQVLLSVVAQAGNADFVRASAAYAAGMAYISPQIALRFQPYRPWTVPLDRALFTLDKLQPAGKARLVEALRKVVRHDAEVTADEDEMLRVIAASLHVPLPRTTPQPSVDQAADVG